MRNWIIVLALALPSVASAQDLAFDCGTPDPAQPELGAHLVKFSDESKGRISIGETQLDAMVLNGLGTLTFLHIGDGFTMQYAVHVEEGFYDYAASGSKMGNKRGPCRKADG